MNTNDIHPSDVGFDVLHPYDPDDVDRPRRVFIGSTVGADGEAVTYLSVTEDARSAAVLLDLEDLRTVVSQLSGHLQEMTHDAERT